MGPGLVIDEAGEELGRGDGAAGAAGDILHVGDVALKLLVVVAAHRQAPERFAGGGTGGGKLGGELVIVAEQAGVFVAEGDDDGAGERGEIDHPARVVGFLRVPEHVGEHEAAFGVGVEHLDRLAAGAAHHVAGALGGAGRHVFHQPDQAHGVDARLAAGEGGHQADHGASAGHVPLHVFHAGGGLDADAAGIEGDALADEGDRLFAAAALPVHDHHARRLGAALADAEQRAEAQRLQLGLAVHFDFQAEIGEFFDAGGEFGRGEDVGRLADQVAGDEHAVGDRAQGGPGGLGGGGLGGEQGEGGELGLVFRLLARAVGVEPVGAQGGAEGCVGGVGAGAVHRDGGDGLARQSVGGGAGGFFDQAGREFGGLAQARDHDAGQAGAGGQDGAGGARLAGELGGGQGAGDCAVCSRVGGLPQPGRRGALGHQQPQRAGLRQGGVGEGHIDHARILGAVLAGKRACSSRAALCQGSGGG